MWGFILPFLSPGTALLWFCQAPFFHTSFSTKRSILSRKRAQPSWSLRTLRVLPQRMTPGAFPLYSHSIHGVPAEEIPGNRGGRNGMLVLSGWQLCHILPRAASHWPAQVSRAAWAVLGAQFGSTSLFPCSPTPFPLGERPAGPTQPQKRLPKVNELLLLFLGKSSPSCVTPQLLTQPAEGKVALFSFWPHRSNGKSDLATWEVCASWRKDKKPTGENKASLIEREVWKMLK